MNYIGLANIHTTEYEFQVGIKSCETEQYPLYIQQNYLFGMDTIPLTLKW